MEFIFDTLYDKKGLSIMAKALRKTTRKKKSRHSHILGILIIICAILLSLPGKNEEFTITINFVVTWAVIIIMVLALIFEDKLNGSIAKNRMLPGTERSVTTFKENVYISETNAGKTEFYYSNIDAIAESAEYFVFIFNKNHAQLYDKNSLTNGTVESFRKFIIERTQKEIQAI